jgi:hypothetical protein
MRALLLTGCCALVLLACGNNDDPEVVVDVESRISIKSGVYGQTMRATRVDSDAPEPFPLALDIVSTIGDILITVATVSSDKDGFYELDLPPGGYAICVSSFGNCQELRVQADQCVRFDYEFGAPAGWSGPRSRNCAN